MRKSRTKCFEDIVVKNHLANWEMHSQYVCVTSNHKHSKIGDIFFIHSLMNVCKYTIFYLHSCCFILKNLCYWVWKLKLYRKLTYLWSFNCYQHSIEKCVNKYTCTNEYEKIHLSTHVLKLLYIRMNINNAIRYLIRCLLVCLLWTKKVELL